MKKAEKVQGAHDIFAQADEQAAEKRTRSSPNFPPDSEVTFLSTENPKRVGSKSYDRWNAYAGATTVGEYIAAGGTYGDLKYDAEHGFVKVAGFDAKVVERKARQPKAEKVTGPSTSGVPAPVKRKGGKKEKAAPATVEAEEETME